jgi:hypothetical protein
MVAAMTKSVGTKDKRRREQPRRALRARAVSEMLPEIGGAAFRRFGFVQSSIVSRWQEIVGDRFGGISAPESIRFPMGKKSQGVLSLVVEGAHAVTMQHVAPEIIERVNRFFGYPAVARLHVRQGLVEVARGKTRRSAPAVPLKPIAPELSNSLRSIDDSELRMCLEALARGISERDTPGKETTAIKVVGRLKG